MESDKITEMTLNILKYNLDFKMCLTNLELFYVIMEDSIILVFQKVNVTQILSLLQLLHQNLM